MSKPESRGSLIGLKVNLPPPPKVPPVQTSAEMEERILGTPAAVDQTSLSQGVETAVFTSVKTASEGPGELERKEARKGSSKEGRKDISMPNLRQDVARRKEPTVLMNAKLPYSLHSRLKRTAQFNDISMTDILIRAIEKELSAGHYTAPPETWGSETV